tara:strand:- start:948 stop:1850 length:903 start_codon:yes stop_codon:yes gene_type:complete
MSYNLLGLPVQGYQKGGGRARALFNVGTSQLKHNIDIEDALEKLGKKKKKTQSWWESASGVTDALSNILTIGSMFIPGMQGLPLLTKALIGTGVKAGTKALSSAAADYLAPKVTTPKKIIDRQFGREGSPAIGTRDWEKIDEAYGDIGKFSNRAGLRMRQGALAGMPADFIQNLMQTYLMSKAFPQSPALEEPIKPSLPMAMGTADMLPNVNVPNFPLHKPVYQTSVAAPEMGAYGTQPESTWMENLYNLFPWMKSKPTASGPPVNFSRPDKYHQLHYKSAPLPAELHRQAASGPYDVDY